MSTAVMVEKKPWSTVEGTTLVQGGGRLAFSPNGFECAISNAGKVRIYTASAFTFRNEWCASTWPDQLELFWSQNSRVLFAVDDKRVYEIHRKAHTKREWNPMSGVSFVAMNDEETFVAIGFKSGKVSVYRTPDQKLMQTIEDGIPNMAVTGIQFTVENEFLVVNTNGDIRRYRVR